MFVVAGICLAVLIAALTPTVILPGLRRAHESVNPEEQAKREEERESDRKADCLSNVKNIAMAINMYVADWAGFWPSEHDMRAIQYFNAAPGGGTPSDLPDICNQATHANPYLREPVVLDDYIKTRDIWRCPSGAKMSGAQFIVPMGRDGYWLNNYLDSPRPFGISADRSYGPCDAAFPPGWGGEVTDSLTQMRVADLHERNVLGFYRFVSGYGINGNCRYLNQYRIDDPAQYMVVFESDLGCSGTGTAEDLVSEPRHLGGDNWGFMDGHAKWVSRQEADSQIQWLP